MLHPSLVRHLADLGLDASRPPSAPLWNELLARVSRTLSEQGHTPAEDAAIHENAAVMRHLAMNLLKADKTTPKLSVNLRRTKAAFDPQYRSHVLGLHA